MKQKQIDILKGNLGIREETDDWINNALSILENNNFGDYRAEIKDLIKQVNHIRERDSIKLAEKQRPIRAKLFAYDFLNR